MNNKNKYKPLKSKILDLASIGYLIKKSIKNRSKIKKSQIKEVLRKVSRDHHLVYLSLNLLFLKDNSDKEVRTQKLELRVKERNQMIM